MLRASRRAVVWFSATAFTAAAAASLTSACGARTSLFDAATSTCAAPDSVPPDDGSVVVPPVAFVPRSVTVAELSSSMRMVLVSASPNACEQFKAFETAPNNLAPSDGRWLQIQFANGEPDAAYDGSYTVPSDCAGPQRCAVAAAAKYCSGTSFVAHWGWFKVPEAGSLANGGVLEISNYVEGDAVSGVYDLQFADGVHVVGNFDAGWCN